MTGVAVMHCGRRGGQIALAKSCSDIAVKGGGDNRGQRGVSATVQEKEVEKKKKLIEVME